MSDTAIAMELRADEAQLTVTRRNKLGTAIGSEVVSFNTDGSVNASCTLVADCEADFTVAAGAACAIEISVDAGNAVGTCSQTPAGPYLPGTHDIALSCDVSGVADSCTTRVTVEDLDAPGDRSCTLPQGTVECGSSLAYTEPTWSDNCGTPTVSCAPPVCALATYGTGAIVCDAAPRVTSDAPESYSLGTTRVTWRITDGSRNAESVSQDVDVLDRVPPMIGCPADIALEPTGPDGAVATFALTSVEEDRCDAAPAWRCDAMSGDTFGVGTETAVGCTASDGSGNQASCSFTVKVLSEQEVVANLDDAVTGLSDAGALNDGQANGLHRQLRSVLNKLDRDKFGPVCEKLDDLSEQLHGWVADGVLTDGEAQPMLASRARAYGAGRAASCVERGDGRCARRRARGRPLLPPRASRT